MGVFLFNFLSRFQELQVKPEKGSIQHVKLFFTKEYDRPVVTSTQLQAQLLYDFLSKQHERMHLVIAVKKVRDYGNAFQV